MATGTLITGSRSYHDEATLAGVVIAAVWELVDVATGARPLPMNATMDEAIRRPAGEGDRDG